MGDLHGSFKALKQVLEKSNFNYQEDKLIFLGDSCDGFSENVECIRELMKIKNLVYIQGNHCYWLMLYLNGKMQPTLSGEYSVWNINGGRSTIESFEKISEEERNEIFEFLKKSVSYHVEDEQLFLHAGYDFHFPIEKNQSYTLMWDRFMVNYVFDNQLKKTIDEKYKNIFVGHTPLQSFDSRKFNPMIPQRWANVWMMDTGCAFTGCLSMMNLETNEVFSSDASMSLYPDERGRNRLSLNELDALIELKKSLGSKKDDSNI